MAYLWLYQFQLYLESNKAQSIKLDENARRISGSTISNDILEIRWPLGVPPPSYPETRHDIIIWTHLNETHQFMPDSESNIKQLSEVDREDFKVNSCKQNSYWFCHQTYYISSLARRESSTER